jgi:hypothetical protein
MKWKSQTHSAFGKFSNLEKFPGITTLFLKLAEDDKLTGLQNITKKAFHMLIPKRTTKHCGTICCSKISSLGELFLFLVQTLIFLNYSVFSAHRLTTWMDYKPLSSFEDMICWSGNLAIWQSGSNLAAIWQQSGSNLVIWEWQSCITATSTSMAMSMAMAMAMAIAMAICYRDCCWNNISRQARRTQWQRTQPFARLLVVDFPNLKLPTEIPPWDELHKTVNSTCWLFLYHLGKFLEKKKLPRHDYVKRPKFNKE